MADKVATKARVTVVFLDDNDQPVPGQDVFETVGEIAMSEDIRYTADLVPVSYTMSVRVTRSLAPPVESKEG